MSNYNKITALYSRLSVGDEDRDGGESNSIQNQKLMLKEFAEKNGMFQYEYYVDDGYTGRNFNRPAFQRMIADIEAGKIGCVITKDLSRLGRNYIEAGSYIEIFFPKHNVRYIAITDGVDSLTRQEMDITPFKNILNDMYSRDISKKVLAGRMTRSRQGKFCGGQPPLGLMRDPEDRGHLILDPETAPVIRKIYDLALDGRGCMRIAKQLMEDKVPITRVKGNTACDVNYYAWGGARISHILRNPFYKGAHLVCRTHQKGIRSNTYDIIPREDWEIIEGCHEAIVTPEKWEQVQAKVLPVSDKFADYAKQVAEALKASGVRVEVDDRDEKLGYKIRQAQLQKVPYMLILGEKEQSAGTVSVRKRDLIDENDSPELGTMSVEEFAAIIKEESQY